MKLRLFLLAVLVVLLSLASAAARQLLHNSNPHNPSIIIIGAGMSGIMTAKTLADNGIKDFVILEATEKIGGRMRKTSFAGLTVELGANWVEGVGGEEENPIWTLAKVNNLRTYYSNYDNITSNFYSQEGHLIPSSILEPRLKLQQAAKEFSNTLSESLHSNKEDDISILASQRMFGQVPTSPLEMAIDFYNYDYEAAGKGSCTPSLCSWHANS